jgi:hypothetical protein
MQYSQMKSSSFFEQLISWAASQSDIKGIALVGSYARGTAGPGSDLDLIVLTSDPRRYLQDRSWLLQFGPVVRTQNETWGRVDTVRSTYEPGLEVEYNFAPLEWADVPLIPVPGAWLKKALGSCLIPKECLKLYGRLQFRGLVLGAQASSPANKYRTGAQRLNQPGYVNRATYNLTMFSGGSVAALLFCI